MGCKRHDSSWDSVLLWLLLLLLLLLSTLHFVSNGNITETTPTTKNLIHTGHIVINLWHRSPDWPKALLRLHFGEERQSIRQFPLGEENSTHASSVTSPDFQKVPSSSRHSEVMSHLESYPNLSLTSACVCVSCIKAQEFAPHPPCLQVQRIHHPGSFRRRQKTTWETHEKPWKSCHHQHHSLYKIPACNAPSTSHTFQLKPHQFLAIQPPLHSKSSSSQVLSDQRRGEKPSRPHHPSGHGTYQASTFGSARLLMMTWWPVTDMMRIEMQQP